MRDRATLFYKLASYVLILFGVVHTAAFFSNPAELLTDERSKEVWQLIDTHRFNVEGMSFTIHSLLMGFNWYLEIFVLGLGVLNLVIVKHLAGNAAPFRLMAIVNAGMIGLLVIVTAIYFHLPPLILFGLAGLFFLIAAFSIKQATASDQ